MPDKEISMDELQHIMADPFYAITIHPMYTVKHKPLVSESEFISVATRSMLEDENGNKLKGVELEMSIKNYMRRLLDNLKGRNL